MRAAEMFCGMGMSALGSVWAGLDLVDAVDMNPAAIEAFNANSHLLPPVARVGWVGEPLAVRKIDVLCGGPVCRAFSPGARLFGTKGAADDRNTFPAFFRVVEAYLPKFVLIENTFGMKAFSGYVSELIGTLQRYGYTVDFQEIDCWDFGVPQTRRRVVFLCSRAKGWSADPPEPRLEGPATLGDVLYDPPADDPWPLLLPISERGLDYLRRDPRHQKKHRWMTPDLPASTVTADYHRGVPYGVVDLDGELFLCGPRLAARLQGLPDEYDLSMMVKTQALRAIGNGFPPQVPAYYLSQL